jgi:pimeloyl-ACP methyl ester carboxylesterase
MGGAVRRYSPVGQPSRCGDGGDRGCRGALLEWALREQQESLMPLAEINGIHVYHETRGEGPPLLLILGTGLDVSELSRMIDGLAAHHRVVAFDNRGAGRSDRPDEPYSIELMASDTFGVMEAAELDRAAVLGISLGGRIAMELALRHPERVERLILVSTGARTIPSWRRRHLWPILATAFARGPYRQPRYAFVRQLAASAGHDATARLGDLTMPTLILHGRSDRSVPLRLAHEMQAAIPGSRMVLFRGGHLFFLLREPARFLESVTDFCHPADTHAPRSAPQL